VVAAVVAFSGGCAGNTACAVISREATDGDEAVTSNVHLDDVDVANFKPDGLNSLSS
jgi:hypothetical protein